jgi:FAD/FMN-containing dehydrogenase
VTIALGELDQVVEIDEVSRAALIQAGAFGPHLGGAPAARLRCRGPDPNRLAIGSEGILGIITRAWMRIQLLPA